MPAILALLAGPFGRIILYAVAALVGTGALLGVYLTWKHGVENAARLEFNAKQMERVISDQKDFIRKQGELNDAQRQAAEQLTAQNEILNKKLDDVSAYLNSPEAIKDDRPSSEVLKRTIEKLRRQR